MYFAFQSVNTFIKGDIFCFQNVTINIQNNVQHQMPCTHIHIFFGIPSKHHVIALISLCKTKINGNNYLSAIKFSVRLTQAI